MATPVPIIPLAMRCDARRDAWLMAQGVAVLRDPASDVLGHPDAIARQIIAIALERRSQFES